MRQFRKLTLTGAALVAAMATAATTAMASGPAASPVSSSPPQAGTITVFSTVSQSLRLPAIVAGAIGGHGTFLSIDRDGRPDINGDYAKVILSGGSFRIDGRQLTRSVKPMAPSNNRTCSVVLAGSGPVPVYDGTGAYAGIHGTLHGTARFGAVVSRYRSGPRAGRCNQSQSAVASVLGSLIMSGRVAF
jgi:hypothetical protein